MSLTAQVTRFQHHMFRQLALNHQHELLHIRRRVPLVITLKLRRYQAWTAIARASRVGHFRGPRIGQQRGPVVVGDDVSVFPSRITRQIENRIADILHVEDSKTPADAPVLRGSVCETDTWPPVLITGVHQSPTHTLIPVLHRLVAELETETGIERLVPGPGHDGRD